MGKLQVILLEETKKNMEQDIGLTLEQMDHMDLGDIEGHIYRKKGYTGRNDPKIKRHEKRVITLEDHEKNVQELIKKYLPKEYKSLYGGKSFFGKIGDYFLKFV